jgi:hypothetical protein
MSEEVKEVKAELEAMKKGQEETQAVVRELRAMIAAFIAAPSNTASTTTTSTTSISPPPPPSLVGDREELEIPETPEVKDQETPVKRELFPSRLPALPLPVAASQRNVAMATSTRQEQLLPPIEEISSSVDRGEHVNQKVQSSHNLQALQKGMQKPPNFEGNTGTKTEIITTWWRQMSNYAKTFPECDRAMLIKSYLRGSASDWLDSQEREIGRELTVEELADGLAQEYGSEVTSEAALQILESITMSSPGCSTLTEYNNAFNKQYNLCSTKDQPIAVRCYVKGLHPKYLELVLQAGERYSNLAEARAAATNAVTKYQQLQIARENHRIQTRASGVSSGTASTVKSATSGDYGVKRTWDSDRFPGTKVNLNAFSVLADSDNPGGAEDDDDDDVSPGSTQDPPTVARAAVMASPATSKYTPNTKKYQLTKEQVDMLRSENRCFKCHKPNHMKKDCRSKAATVAPSPLK